MQRTKFLTVSQEVADEMNRLCEEPDGSVGKNETVFDEEVVFLNGMRVAIQVVADSDPRNNPCWTQGVLFDQDGNEISCSEVDDSLLGSYHLFDGDEEYIVEVKV